MVQIKKQRLLITEITMTLVLVLFISLCLRGKARDDVSINEISPAVLQEISNTENMQEAGAMKLRSLYGLSENDYESVLLYIPASNMDAQELLLVVCRSEDQTKAVEEAMHKRIEYQVSIFESYGVEQMGIINKAVVDVRGRYCLYVCDENSSSVKQAFERAVTK